jgi:hypothetical protein
MGLRAILNYLDTRVQGETTDGEHIARPAREVNHDDRFHAGCHSRGNCVRSYILRITVNIREHRPGTHRNHCTGGREVSPARNHYLISRPDIESAQRKLEGDRAVRQCDGVATSYVLRKLSLELAPFVTGPIVDPSGSENGCRRRDFIVRKVWPWRKRE